MRTTDLAIILAVQIIMFGALGAALYFEGPSKPAPICSPSKTLAAKEDA